MKKTVFILFAAIVFASTVKKAQADSATIDSIVAIIPQSSVNVYTTLTVTSNGGQPTYFNVNYGPSPNVNNNSTISYYAPVGTTQIVVSISNLTPGTNYSFKALVTWPGVYQSNVVTYMTSSCSFPISLSGTLNSICPGNTSTLSINISGSPTSITWYLNGSVVSNGGTSYIANQTGSYTVAVTQNGCTSTSNTFVISSANTSAIASAANSQICEGGSTSLNAGGGGVSASYFWSPTTGLSNPNIANPTASPTMQTTYTVTITNGTCVSSASTTVNVVPSPTVSVTTTGGGSCGMVTNLSATGGVNYSWSPTTGLSNSNIANPTASPTMQTTYTVTGHSALGGCTNSASITVSPSGQPVSLSLSASQTTICQGEFVDLYAGATGGNVSVTWSPSTGLTSITSSSVRATPNQTTVYTCVATDSVGGCTETSYITIVVNQKPSVSSWLYSYTTFNNMNEGVLMLNGVFPHITSLTISWGGGSASYSANSSSTGQIIFNNIELYEGDLITVTDMVTGCEASFFAISTIGIHELPKVGDDIVFAPNPFVDFTKVNLNNTGYEVKIFDNAGRLIKNFVNEHKNFILTKDELPSGIYNLFIYGYKESSRTGIVSKRFVVM